MNVASTPDIQIHDNEEFVLTGELLLELLLLIPLLLILTLLL